MAAANCVVITNGGVTGIADIELRLVVDYVEGSLSVAT